MLGTHISMHATQNMNVSKNRTHTVCCVLQTWKGSLSLGSVDILIKGSIFIFFFLCTHSQPVLQTLEIIEQDISKEQHSAGNICYVRVCLWPLTWSEWQSGNPQAVSEVTAQALHHEINSGNEMWCDERSINTFRQKEIFPGLFHKSSQEWISTETRAKQTGILFYIFI